MVAGVVGVVKITKIAKIIESGGQQSIKISDR